MPSASHTYLHTNDKNTLILTALIIAVKQSLSQAAYADPLLVVWFEEAVN